MTSGEIANITSKKTLDEAMSIFNQEAVRIIYREQKDLEGKGAAFDPKRYYDRKGSSNFEDDIKVLLNSHNSEIVCSVQNELAQLDSPYILKELDAPDNVTESTGREVGDITLVWEKIGKDLIVPVNIKHTSGKTHDNVGGWEALAVATFGYENRSFGKGKIDFFNKVAKNGVSSSEDDDYYLWVFLKPEDPKLALSDMLSTGHMDGLLSAIDCVAINLAQTMPLQYRSGTYTPRTNKVIARWEIINKICSKGEAKAQKEYASYHGALERSIKELEVLND